MQENVRAYFVIADIYTFMPGQRSAGQKLIPVSMNGDFVEQIDLAVESSGYSDRAKFIRDAIVEKLQTMGIEIPPHLSAAPSKMGKGGRRKTGEVNRSSQIVRYPVHHAASQAKLNDQKISSKQPSPETAKAPSALKTAMREYREQRLLRAVGESSARKQLPKAGTGRHSKSRPESPGPVPK